MRDLEKHPLDVSGCDYLYIYNCGRRWGFFLGSVGTLLVVMTIVLLAACDQPRDKAPDAPSAVIPKIDPPADQFSRWTFQQKNGGSVEKVSGQGAGMTATGDKASTQIDSSAPAATLTDGGTATGGGTRGKLSGQITDNQRQLACIGIGAAGLLAGLWLLSKGNRHGIAIAGGGGCLVAAGLMPVWFWPLIGIAAVGAGAYWLWTAHLAGLGKNYRDALRAVTAGVEAAPEMAKKMVKESISVKADGRHKDTIRKFTDPV